MAFGDNTQGVLRAGYTYFMHKAKSFLSQASRAAILSAIVAGTFGTVMAWTGPTAVPPGGNTAAPINTSAAGQTKAGSFTTSSYIDATGPTGNWAGIFRPAGIYGIVTTTNSAGYWAYVGYSSYGLLTNGDVCINGGKCLSSTASGPTVGGGFENLSNGQCWVVNSVTGGCSCPSYAPYARNINYSYYNPSYYQYTYLCLSV